MKYKRPDVGLKIYREALARFTEFSNLRLGVYTPYVHENSNQSLNTSTSKEEQRFIIDDNILVTVYYVFKNRAV